MASLCLEPQERLTPASAGRIKVKNNSIYNRRMAHLLGTERERYVKKTFKSVARRYNMMNHLMTFGVDILLRKEVMRIAKLRNGERLLDIGAGTGDLSREARHTCPGAGITAADFSMEMMAAGKDWETIHLCQTDALALPFSHNTFDVVVSGYLVRNVVDLDAALAEQYRVLKSGGRVVVLDTTRPRWKPLNPLIKSYFRYVIPSLGRLFTGNGEAYTYLTQSSENFISAEDLADSLRRCGFTSVTFRVRMLGTMAIHSASKRP